MPVSDLIGELRTLAASLRETADGGNDPSIVGVARRLLQACVDVSQAWSGSFIGYHATVYYEGLQLPPQGAFFSSEWGLLSPMYGNGSRGNWVEYRHDDIIKAIEDMAGRPHLGPLDEYAQLAQAEFEGGVGGHEILNGDGQITAR